VSTPSSISDLSSELSNASLVLMGEKTRVIDHEEADASHSTNEDASAHVKPSELAGPANAPVVSQDKEKVAATMTSHTAGVKRQRTLMDMFSSSNTSATSAEPSSKKPRTGGSSAGPSGATGTSAKSSVAATTDSSLQPLNSIPYSPSAFVASLSDDQKRLLQLEVDTMGKSWCACALLAALKI
jgi:hypothetical protein